MEEKERINKLVLTAGSIETSKGWAISSEDNLRLCEFCKSPLFYIHIVWGIVEEADLLRIKVLGHDHKFHYSLREIGLVLYCAECGNFDEHYFKYFYPEDKVVCSLDDKEIGYIEMDEVRHCIEQWNRKGSFKPNYPSPGLVSLRKRFEEYESKLYPLVRKRKKDKGEKINK